MSDQLFNVRSLRTLHDELVLNKTVHRHNADLVVERLRQLAEMVVYGDNNNELLFDFFCEMNMLSLFLEIMWTESGCPMKVHVQILQTLSILISCVRNETSLYYLLSNNYINEIIIYPHNFDVDDDGLCDQFVSFLKTLSLRLNEQTVQFFFVERTGSFPLLSRAIDLLHHHEPMVRIAAQATVLNVYQVKECRARQYALQDEVMHRFFSQIVTIMEAHCASLFRLVQQYHTLGSSVAPVATFVRSPGLGMSAGMQFKKLTRKDEEIAYIERLRQHERIEEQLKDLLISIDDWLYYLQDIFSLQIMTLRRALVHHLVTEFLYPALMEPLLKVHLWSRATLYHIPVTLQNIVEEEWQQSLHKSMDTTSSSSSFSTSNNSKSHGKVRGAADSVPSSSSSSSSQESADETECEEAALALVTALVYILKMLRIITDKMMHRALAVALFHPYSRKGRKKMLHELMLDGEGLPVDDAAAPASVSEGYRNPYRRGVEALFRGFRIESEIGGDSAVEAVAGIVTEAMTGDGIETGFTTGQRGMRPRSERFALLGALLLHNLVAGMSSGLDFNICSGRSMNARSKAREKARDGVNEHTIEDGGTETKHEADATETTAGDDDDVVTSIPSLNVVTVLRSIGVLPRKPVRDGLAWHGLEDDEDVTFEDTAEPITPEDTDEEGGDEEEGFFDTDEGSGINESVAATAAAAVSTASSSSVSKIARPTWTTKRPSNKSSQEPLGGSAGARQSPKSYRGLVNGIVIASTEQDDAEDRQAEAGLCALEPDVMSVHKLLALEHYALETARKWKLRNGGGDGSREMQEMQRSSVHCVPSSDTLTQEDGPTHLSVSSDKWLPEQSLLDTTLLHVLANPDEYPLVVVQIAVHSVHLMLRMVQLALVERSVERTSACGKKETTTDASSPAAAAAITVRVIDCRSTLQTCITAATQQACALVLHRLQPPSTQAGLVVHILLEELHRSKDRCWSEFIGKMNDSVALLLPLPPIAVTPFVSLLSSDAECTAILPGTNDVEKVRREIQIVLLLRSLSNHTQALIRERFALRVPSDDLLSAAEYLEMFPVDATKQPFHLNDEVDMKGRRFLDAFHVEGRRPSHFLVTPPDNVNANYLSCYPYFIVLLTLLDNDVEQPHHLPAAADPPTSPYSNEHFSLDRTKKQAMSLVNTAAESLMSVTSSASFFTFGLLGRDDHQDDDSEEETTTAPPSTSNATPAKQQQQLTLTNNVTNTTITRKKKYGDLLFLQDDKYLVLVAPSRTARTVGSSKSPGVCSVFKVWMVAPLTLTDCQIDPQDRRILRLVVRSWDNDVLHMTKLKPSSPGIIIPPPPPVPSSSSSSASCEVRTVLPTLLRPRLEARGALWSVAILLDSEYSASLAVSHITTARDALLDQRLNQLRRLLDESSGIVVNETLVTTPF